MNHQYRLAYFIATIVVMVVSPLLLTLLPIVFLALFLRMQYRYRTRPSEGTVSRFRVPKSQTKTLVLRDKVKLTYYVIRGTTKKTMVFAAGLGCASTFTYWAAPIIHHFGPEWNYIYWDYRGLFDSEPPRRVRRLAVVEHAEDLAELMRAEKIPVIDALVGHSMGGMVSLEFAALYPEKVDSIIFANSGHGQVFSSVFQPFFRVPGARAICAWGFMLIDQFIPLPHKNIMVYVTSTPIWKLLRQMFRTCLHVYTSLFGSPFLHQLLGPTYLEDFFEIYIGDLFRSPQHFATYVRLFEELDSYSVFHILPRIQHPVLIFTGLWDPLIPAYQGFEMAERLPNCEHVLGAASSHATFLEQPGLTIKHMDDFVNRRSKGIRFKRRNSVSFIAEP